MDISNSDLNELDVEMAEEEFIKKLTKNKPEVLPYFTIGRIVGRMDILRTLMKIVDAHTENFKSFVKMLGIDE